MAQLCFQTLTPIIVHAVFQIITQNLRPVKFSQFHIPYIIFIFRFYF